MTGQPRFTLREDKPHIALVLAERKRRCIGDEIVINGKRIRMGRDEG